MSNRSYQSVKPIDAYCWAACFMSYIYPQQIAWIYCLCFQKHCVILQWLPDVGFATGGQNINSVKNRD
jgi:hypothetical protein